MKIKFPDPKLSSPDGLIAVGGDLSEDNLKSAYSQGIFPWPQEGLPLLWFSPDPRGIIEFKDFHISKSLNKFHKKVCEKQFWKITFNQASTSVIEECRLQKRPNQDSTWILKEMVPAYSKLIATGNLITCEVWENSVLVGGIYGVLINNYFSGESMFYKKPNASKIALCFLVEKLKNQHGLSWMDIQMVTPLTKDFGGKYISRKQFLKKIKASI